MNSSARKKRGRGSSSSKSRSKKTDRRDHKNLPNGKFTEFFSQPFISPSRKDYDEFIRVLCTPLPVTFRIASDHPEAAATVKWLSSGVFDTLRGAQIFESRPNALKVGIRSPDQVEKDLKEPNLPQFKTIEIDGEEISAKILQSGLKYINWYPSRMCWELPCCKSDLRKSMDLEPFRKFLVKSMQQALLHRQELVSMVPPLFLDVKPGHRVIDMCSSPGSKTSQILSLLIGDNEEENIFKGLLVANDLTIKKCSTLISNISRYNYTGLIVTAQDASQYPIIYNDDGSRFFFDRVLADVPCSGTGTCRKNPDVFESFSPRSGNVLHPIQLKIAIRAMSMLKVGGQMVYSTCSLNPIENEAVVAALMKHFDGCIEIVKVEKICPDLKRRAGQAYWKVPAANRVQRIRRYPTSSVIHKLNSNTPNGSATSSDSDEPSTSTTTTDTTASSKTLKSPDLIDRTKDPKSSNNTKKSKNGSASKNAIDFSEFPEREITIPKQRLDEIFDHSKLIQFFESWDEARQVVKFHSKDHALIEPTMFPPPDAKSLGLEHTMRFFPQDQDTGGFFVAVLKKVKPFRSDAKLAPKSLSHAPRNSNGKTSAVPSEDINFASGYDDPEFKPLFQFLSNNQYPYHHFFRRTQTRKRIHFANADASQFLHNCLKYGGKNRHSIQYAGILLSDSANLNIKQALGAVLKFQHVPAARFSFRSIRCLKYFLHSWDLVASPPKLGNPARFGKYQVPVKFNPVANFRSQLKPVSLEGIEREGSEHISMIKSGLKNMYTISRHWIIPPQPLAQAICDTGLIPLSISENVEKAASLVNFGPLLITAKFDNALTLSATAMLYAHGIVVMIDKQTLGYLRTMIQAKYPDFLSQPKA